MFSMCTLAWDCSYKAGRSRWSSCHHSSKALSTASRKTITFSILFLVKIVPKEWHISPLPGHWANHHLSQFLSTKNERPQQRFPLSLPSTPSKGCAKTQLTFELQRRLLHAPTPNLSCFQLGYEGHRGRLLGHWEVHHWSWSRFQRKSEMLWRILEHIRERQHWHCVICLSIHPVTKK